MADTKKSEAAQAEVSHQASQRQRTQADRVRTVIAVIQDVFKRNGLLGLNSDDEKVIEEALGG